MMETFNDFRPRDPYVGPRRGPKPKSDKVKRVKINLRISPQALAFLNRLKEKNHGRAVDKLVKLHRALLKQVEQG